MSKDSKNRSPWTEHTDSNGRTFYYNMITGKSEWTKPEEMKETVECDWNEYTTEEGKKYYHNSKTKVTQWDMPKEYKEFLDKKQDSKKEDSTENDKDDETKMQTFREILREKGMSVYWTQEQALQATKDDTRCRNLKLTNSMKKQVIQSYLGDLKRDEKEAKMRKIKQQEEDFIILLFDTPQIGKDTSFREAMTLISADSRFLGVSQETEREKLFEEFLNRRARKERDEDQLKREKDIENYKNYLSTHPQITINTQWREFNDFANLEQEFENLDKLDRLKYFMDHIDKLDAIEEEKQREEKLDKRRKDRICREHYRHLLREQLEKGNINVKTRWKEFKPYVENDKRYVDMLDTNGSTPASLFYDIIEELEDIYHKEKKKIKEVLKETNITIDQNSPWEFYEQTVGHLRETGKVDQNNFKFIYEDLKEKAIKQEEKIKNKAKKRFNNLLKNTKISKSCTWAKIKEHLPISESPDEIPLTEEERRIIFEDHLRKRSQNNDFDSTSDEEEGAIRERKPRDRKKRHHDKKKKKRKRSKSNSSSESKDKRSKKRDRSDDSDTDKDRKRQRTKD